MLTLSQHIEYLISRHDCVILPGIGAFIAVGRSAELDRNTGIFMPPRRLISYNPAVTNDDGLLAHSIARKERVSFEEGRRILEFKLIELRRCLKENEKCTLGKVGTLAMESDGRMTFRPALTVQQKEHKSGLTSIMLNPLTSERSGSAAKEKTGTTVVPSLSDNRYYHIRIPKAVVRAAASVMIVICTMMALMVTPGDTMKDVSKASVVEVESIIKAIEPKKEKVVAAPVAQEKRAPATDDSKITSEKYHLIVGTFDSEAKANEYISMHPSSNLYIVGGEGHCWRVAVASSDNRSELQQLLNDQSVRENFYGAWIWVKH